MPQPSPSFASGLSRTGGTGHLVVNDQGERLNIKLTPGNIDDRKPVPDRLKAMFGKVFADRGYVSQALFEPWLHTCGIELFAKPKRNMKPRLMRLTDKLLARQRTIIESSIDQLRHISQIEPSRHRTPVNFCLKVLGRLDCLLPSAEEAHTQAQRCFCLIPLAEAHVS